MGEPLKPRKMERQRLQHDVRANAFDTLGGFVSSRK